jgi:hypothetical protein
MYATRSLTSSSAVTGVSAMIFSSVYVSIQKNILARRAYKEF